MLAAVTGAVAAGGTARAQQVAASRSFDGDMFQPAIGPRNFLTLSSPDVPNHLQFALGLHLDFQRFPYKIATGRPGEATETKYPIRTQLKSELHLAIGLIDRLQVGVAVPVTLVMRGDGIDGASGLSTGSDLSTAGLGDLRVEVKGQILTAGQDDQFVLGGLIGGTIPTGKKDSYIGEKSATGRAEVLAALTVGRLRLGGEAGALLRKTTETFDAEVGNQLLYGVGASVGLLRGFEVLGELAGRSGFKDFSKRYWDENPLEVDVAARAYPLGMVGITGGLGFGLGKGIGAPQMRIFLGAVFTPDFRDADGDGVYDSEDRCPDQPEDRDGWKDNDGCPDPDNDADGIPDALDKCPNDAEDMDQFEDEDGCPDPDNDKDGIPDLNDACPNAKEDGHGKRPTDGCPSTAEDQDGDGISDATDKCPDEPEDKDGYQDDDGCPDPDNDNDGIPDGFDNCPNDAEDTDQFEDEDGCPDPDNDKDGIPDTADKCPNKPETLNGVQDDDGCPDNGAEIVRLLDDRIEVVDKIAFATRHGQSDLKDSALTLIKLVGLVMKGHPEIAKLRIEVHSEKKGGLEEAKHRADLIRDALVAVGVKTDRLIPSGKADAGGGSHIDFLIGEKTAPKQLTPSAPPPPPKGPPAIP
jgi:OmpA-OmpF porin, OOP family